MSISYFVGPKYEKWNPNEIKSEMRKDCIYLGKVFQEMERKLNVGGKNIKVYVTWNVNEIPDEGNNVVAVVVGDEFGQPPLYSKDVGVIFKQYGSVPDWEPYMLNMGTKYILWALNSVRKYAISFSNLIGDLVNKLRQKMFNKVKSSRYEIPIGYRNTSNIEPKKILNRNIDVFFAGTIGKRHSPLRLKGIVTPPKIYSRMRMLKYSSRLEKKLNIRTKIEASFNREGTPMNKREYYKSMANSKICLVPRGSNIETWRLFEAAKYGCAIITERLPNRWYYKNDLFVQIDDWSQVGKYVKNILEDNEILRNLHLESAEWWKKVVSERAIGEFMAERIKKDIINDG